MQNLTSTYHSKIYRGFKEIEPNEHQARVRYYETYENQIRQLDFSEYFELLIAYTEALFEVGAYQNHMFMADRAIEISIANNIRFYNKKDIFCELLFKKAASCFNLMRYNEAEHILRELIKIDPFNEMSVRFLKKCLVHKKPKFVRTARAVSILLFFVFCFDYFYRVDLHPAALRIACCNGRVSPERYLFNGLSRFDRK